MRATVIIAVTDKSPPITSVDGTDWRLRLASYPSNFWYAIGADGLFDDYALNSFCREAECLQRDFGFMFRLFGRFCDCRFASLRNHRILSGKRNGIQGIRSVLDRVIDYRSGVGKKRFELQAITRFVSGYDRLILEIVVASRRK